MTDRSVVLKGPFTDDDLREIVETMQRIEGRRPDETFNVLLDAEDDEIVNGFMERINPLRGGYARVVKFFPRK